MNILGLSIMLVLILVVLFGSRRAALVAMMAGVLYLTQGQQVLVLGFHFTAIKFIELAAFVRIMLRREFSFSTLNRIDYAVLLLYAYTTIVFLIRSNDGQANQISYALDAVCCYFAFRGLVTCVDDLLGFLPAFLVLLAPYVVLLFIESFTNHNPFSSMGVYVGSLDAMVRGGRIRVFGSFRHPSLLGTLGGSFLPIYIGLWFNKKYRRAAFIGIALCLAIVWVSNSGGPINCVAAGLVGWMLWTIRTRMQWVRRGIVAAIVLGALFMKSPIWYLPAKASNVSGGDGWHRSYLLDVAFRHIDRWWFAGMPTLDTADWFPYHLSGGGSDLTNHFLNFGITAGIGSILLLVLVLTLTFSSLGKALASHRSAGETRRNDEFLYWGLGVVVAVHMVNWFGIAYFDQTYVLWFMQLATISSLVQFSLSSVPFERAARTSSNVSSLMKTTANARRKHSENAIGKVPSADAALGRGLARSRVRKV